MENFTSFSEFLKAEKAGLKALVPVKDMNVKRKEKNVDRLTQRDKIRASHRTMTDSPVPPTPLKRNAKASNETVELESKSKQTSSKSSVQKNDMKSKQLLEKLSKYRQLRDQKRAEEKAKRKPMFKITTHIDYKEKDKEILGSFAQANHKFKPPSNVKAIPLVNTSNVEKVPALPVPARRRLNYAGNKNPSQGGSTTSGLKVEKVPSSRVRTTRNVPPPAPTTRVTRQNSKAKELPKTENAQKETTKKESVKITGKKVTPAATATSVTSKTKELPKTKKAPEKQVSRATKSAQKVDNKTTTTNKMDNSNVEIPVDTLKEVKVNPDVKRKSKLTRSNAILVEIRPDVVEKPSISKSETPKSKRQSVKTPRKSSIRSTSAKNTEKVSASDSKHTPAAEPSITRKSSTKKTPKSRKSTLSITSNGSDDVFHDGTHDQPPISQKSQVTESSSSASTVYPINTSLNSTFTISEEDVDDVKTPDQKSLDTSVYVSPFVTMSRGKTNARKEYKSRSSRGGESLISPETTGIKAGAQYFYKLLEDEIARIREFCAEWQAYKDNIAVDLPEEVSDMINVAIGPSNLLITQKMSQFRQLIDNSVTPTEGPLITCTDLHGFWDTIQIQINNLHERFANLEKMRANNWNEILDVNRKSPKPKVIKSKPKAKKKAVPKSSATSKLRDAIKAARANKNKQLLVVDPVPEFDGGFFSFKSPTKEIRTPHRTSLLRKVLVATTDKKRVSSPGLAMMQATRLAHEVAEVTPKSILKLATPKSSVRKSKAVLFKEKEAEVLHFHDGEDNENNLNSENIPDTLKILKKDTASATPRRSSRNKLSLSNNL